MDRRRNAGITLIEIMVTVALVGALAVMAIPRMDDFFDRQDAKAAARAVADALLRARAEAMRTGNHFIVFFGGPGTTDGNGTAIEDEAGNFVPILILDDGPPATANCRIDGGETREYLYPIDGMTWGVTSASAAAPGDVGAAPYASGFSFADFTLY